MLAYHGFLIATVGATGSPPTPLSLFKLPTSIPSQTPAIDVSQQAPERGVTINQPNDGNAPAREGGGAGEIFRWMDGGDPSDAKAPDEAGVPTQKSVESRLQVNCTDEAGKVYKDSEEGYSFCLERYRAKTQAIQRAQVHDGQPAGDAVGFSYKVKSKE